MKPILKRKPNYHVGTGTCWLWLVEGWLSPAPNFTQRWIWWDGPPTPVVLACSQCRHLLQDFKELSPPKSGWPQVATLPLREIRANALAQRPSTGSEAKSFRLLVKHHYNDWKADYNMVLKMYMTSEQMIDFPLPSSITHHKLRCYQPDSSLRIIRPSKLAILRTLPLLYRFKPFHWRVQDPKGCWN